MSKHIKIMPYLSKQGYFHKGFWEPVTYEKVINLNNEYPQIWNLKNPQHKPVAIFIQKVYRVINYGKKSLVRVEMFYMNSQN